MNCYHRLPQSLPSTLRRALCNARSPAVAVVPGRGSFIYRANRSIHSGSPRLAVAHPPNVHGPPPATPASATEVRQRWQRDKAEKVKRDHEEVALEEEKAGAKEGASANTTTTTPAYESPLRRRFWKDVHVRSVPEGYQILLDSRPVRTTDKNILIIPHTKPFLAHAVALEWDSLTSGKQALKHHFIPLTSLAARALDIALADAAKPDPASYNAPRQEITQLVMRYMDTDTLLSWAPEANRYDDLMVNSASASDSDSGETKPTSLRDLQVQTAQPIVSYLVDRVWPGVELRPAFEGNNIMPTPQPLETQHVVRGWVMNLPPFELAGLERAALASKSLLIAARLVVEWSEELKHLRHEKDQAGAYGFGIEEAAEASSLEVTWQTRKWGEVEDTHDVDREDIRRQLGSVILLVSAQEQQ